MKHEKISIKWKLFAYLLVFTGVLLLALWMCQTVYLDSFYKFIKKSELEKAISQITQNLNEDNVDELVDTIAAEYEICIRITNTNWEDIALAKYYPNSSIQSLPKEILQAYYKEAKENGGFLEYTSKEDGQYQIKRESASREPLRIQDQPMQPPDNDNFDYQEKFRKDNRTMPESVVCVQIKEVSKQTWMILVDASLSPVDATVYTLRIQLIWISVIMLLLALGMAFLISRIVSTSIIKTNISAKELAKGNFGIVFEGKDYREIAELSDTLNYAAGELAKTERLQRELIANVSHDLRTPLTMIIAYSEVMRDLPGENSPENVQVVIDEAQRLTNLVNDMLDISKLQAGALQMDTKVYNLTESIESVMERYVKLKEQDGYNIQFEYKEQVMVKADEFKIFQVLYNLINNAINYAGEDKFVCVKQSVIGDKVRVEVMDRGPGIAKNEIPFVWERYYKVDKTHKRAIKGTGLGLSIVKNILKLHHAEYGVDSEVGKGSVFWFELRIENL